MDGARCIPAMAQNTLFELHGGARAACAAHELATVSRESWAVSLVPAALSRFPRRGRGRVVGAGAVGGGVPGPVRERAVLAALFSGKPSWRRKRIKKGDSNEDLCRAKGVALAAAKPRPFNASIARARCSASIETSSPLVFGGPGCLALATVQAPTKGAGCRPVPWSQRWPRLGPCAAGIAVAPARGGRGCVEARAAANLARFPRPPTTCHGGNVSRSNEHSKAAAVVLRSNRLQARRPPIRCSAPSCARLPKRPGLVVPWGCVCGTEQPSHG